MADNHYNYDKGSYYGALLHGPIIAFERELQNLVEIQGTMQSMIDGDGSAAEHFTQMVTHFGFDSDAQAKAAYEELSAGVGKITTDASVSNVKAALAQMINRLR